MHQVDINPLKIYSDSSSLMAKTTKETIIEILSENWPITVNTIFTEMRRSRRSNISYQAVHKAIKELLDDQIIEKNQKGYSISLNWIQKTKAKTQKLEQQFLNRQKILFSTLKEGESTNLRFSTTSEMGRFALYDLLIPENIDEKQVIFKMWNAWPVVALNDIEFKKMNEIISKTNLYITITHESEMDKSSGKIWKKAGAKIKFGIDCDPATDYIIVGDLIVSFYFPETKKIYREICKRIKNTEGIVIQLLFKFLFQTQNEILTTISRNKILADEMRNETLRIFKD